MTRSAVRLVIALLAAAVITACASAPKKDLAW